MTERIREKISNALGGTRTHIFGNLVYYTGHLEKCEGAIPHFWAKFAQNRTILAKFWAKI